MSDAIKKIDILATSSST